MRFSGKLGTVILALAFVFASAYIASAGTENQTSQDGKVQIGNRNLKTTPASYSQQSGKNSSTTEGAMRVDRDLEIRHQGDINQVGGDEAYNSMKRRSTKESDRLEHNWNPGSYGLGGYSRDEH